MPVVPILLEDYVQSFLDSSNNKSQKNDGENLSKIITWQNYPLDICAGKIVSFNDKAGYKVH